MNVIDAIQAGERADFDLALGADPAQANSISDEGVPALRLAAYFGRKEMVAALLAAGAKADLHTAAALGEVQDGDLASYSSDGWTPLHLAAFFGHLDAVQEFLRRGADVRARSTNALKNLPIHAAAAGRHRAVVAALIHAGSPVNDQQHGGYTPLHSAAQNGDLEMTRMLLQAGADPKIAAGIGKTPAGLAREKGFDELAALLERG